jgi:hypothetical protein
VKGFSWWKCCDITHIVGGMFDVLLNQVVTGGEKNSNIILVIYDYFIVKED